MMDRLFSNSVLMLESAMNFQWTKMSVINNNIVNAETPGYKAKYVTFEESTRMDDNGVTVSEQITEATRNALQMQYTMDAINSNLSLLRSVIRGQ